MLSWILMHVVMDTDTCCHGYEYMLSWILIHVVMDTDTCCHGY